MHEQQRRRRFWYLRRRPATVRAEVDEELALHLELTTRELTEGGLTPAEARREALRRFGDLEATRRYCRAQDERRETDVQRALWLEDLGQDLRLGVRSLSRVPLLALTIVLTVGVGIGATTAIFSAIDAALLDPLPYAEPSRLTRIYTDTPPFKFRLSAADYLTLRDQQTQFERLATFTDRTMSYAGTEAAELVRTRIVSWPFFSVLGLRPVLGRDFSEADGRPGSPLVVIATHGFWQGRLGGRADAVGRPVRLDGADYVVVGVLEPSAGPLERRDLFVIQQFTPPPRKGPFLYSVIGRLRSGTTSDAAGAELRAINRAMFPRWKASYQDERSTWALEDLQTSLVGDVETVATLALAAVGLVWLIACANASNLLIARAAGRRQELSVRAALGASRARVVRYLLAESAVLASAAMIIGAGLAWAGVQLLRSAGASYLPRTQEIALDGTVLALLIALAAASTLIFGLVPAWHASAAPAEDALRTHGRSTAGPRAQWLRRTLVGAQFAIAAPLLIVATLLGVSLYRMQRVDLGFESDGVLTASIRLPGAQYPQEAQATAFWRELQARVARQPGVTGVAFADGLPPNNVGNRNNFDLEQFPTPQGQSQPVTPWVAVSPEYFAVVGLTLHEGRLLDARDAEREALEAVVVDRAWAQRFFPGESAVGKRFREGGCTSCPWTAVVGVVSTVKYAGLDQPDEGTVYTPLPPGIVRYVVVRAGGQLPALASSLQRTLRELEPGAPLSEVAAMDELVSRSLDRPHSLAWLVASVALVALLLSVVGIYGVMGYYVQQAQKEISLRMALGSSAGRVMRLVVGQGMRVVCLGLAAGLVAALGLTRLAEGLLFGVAASDVRAYVAVGLLLTFASLAACAVPAWRATSRHPASVLRTE